MQSRIDQLEKEEKPRVEKEFKFHTKSMESLGNKTIIRIEHEDIQRGEKNIIEDGTLFVKAGEKIAITGRNGSGKATLLNHIHEKYKHSTLKIGYFYQQLESLDNEKTIIENISETSLYDETTVRTMLARLGIRREAVHRKVRVISGGERAKVQLVKILMSDIQVLMEEEPTNLLDSHTLDALEEIDVNQPATIILEYHDKVLKERVHDIEYEVKDG